MAATWVLLPNELSVGGPDLTRGTNPSQEPVCSGHATELLSPGSIRGLKLVDDDLAQHQWRARSQTPLCREAWLAKGRGRYLSSRFILRGMPLPVFGVPSLLNGLVSADTV